MNTNFDADVAIIGYGPSGVAAANCLGAYGVKAIAFERDKSLYSRARAVTMNDWTLRCFQSVGLDQELVRDMEPTTALRWVTYDGKQLLRMDFPPSTLSNGGPRSYQLYQPITEQTLRDGAARYADHVSVRYGHEVIDVAQDAESVTLTTRDLASDTVGKSRVRYAIAADGGSSATRGKVGVTLLGDTNPTMWVVIDAKVKRWWPNRNILTFWSDKKRPAVDIALANGFHRWELPLEPHEKESDFQTPEQLWRLLRDMGVTPDHVDIHQHAFYRHHVREADRWRVGRVFLVGDAGHLMPPWAGSGMQSGIRDSFNLCWKLHQVLAGKLPVSLLDSYEVERRANVALYTEITVQLGRLIKQQMTEEELAALQPPPGAPPEEPPLIRAPVLEGGWLRGATTPTSIVGKMVPQPRVAGCDGKPVRLDDMLGNGFALLGDGIDPVSLLSDDERRQWEKLGARTMAVRPADQNAQSENEVIDLDGKLLAWMRSFKARAIAVRPDRFVMACDGSGLRLPD